MHRAYNVTQRSTTHYQRVLLYHNAEKSASLVDKIVGNKRSLHVPHRTMCLAVPDGWLTVALIIIHMDSRYSTPP